MRCTHPRTVGFKADGRTICWSQKHRSKEYATFQLPCGQCLECRLDYARQWAIRCVHEAQMHPKNSFVTLTYSDENLTSPKLDYSHFQKFMKKLRKLQNEPIGVFVTGEYGDRTKRPHWHAILFNWSPADATYHRSTDRGDRVYRSATLDAVWSHGITELGSVTFESAGYCARYAAKKLIHGHDDTHDFHPISKKSSKHAIGKKFLEQFWPDIFNEGHIVLPDGNTCSVPRYYEKWFKENKPTEWLRYVTETKEKKILRASSRAEKDLKEYVEANVKRSALAASTGILRGHIPTRAQAREKILNAKFKLLQSYLKL